MTIQRLSLSNIATEIKRIVGFPGVASSDTPWATDEDLYRIVNGYGQRLGIRAAQVIGEKQQNQPLRAMRFDMYRTTTTSEVSALTSVFSVITGSNVISFPEDLDEIISIWDLEYDKPLHKVEDVARWHPYLRKRKPGPPEYYEMFGLSGVKRLAHLHPTPPAGFTPSLELVYWRMPATMPQSGLTADTSYPDADIKYHWLWVYGPAAEILRSGHPAYDRYAALEKELLIDLAKTAHWV